MAESLILGSGIQRFGRFKDGSTPRDWSHAVVDTALAESGVTLADVDTMIVGVESDHLTLQLSPGALLADELALHGIPVVRVEAGGASGGMAVRQAHAHVQAGMARCVLVLGFEHAASHLKSDEISLVYGLSFDADLEGFAGVTPATEYALSIRAHMERYGTTEEQLAAISVKNHGNALANPFAHLPLTLNIDDVLASPPVSAPYRRLDCSPLSDGAAAVVVAADDWAPQSANPRVRIAGSGCANDYVRIGDRDEPDRFAAKTYAAQQAYTQAGVMRPRGAIDVAEVYDAFTGAEIQAIEALGLGVPGHVAVAAREGRFNADGELPINVSGGLLGQGGAPGATGVAQIATLSRLLTDTYWWRPPTAETFRRAVADCHGGVGTVCVVHVLEGVHS